MPLTEVEKKQLAKRKKRAEFLKAQADRLATLETSQKSMTDQVAALIKGVEGLKTVVDGFNPKQLLQEVERLKAGQTEIRRNIQRSSAIQIPGSEDLAGKFSIGKAIIAAKTNGQRFGDTPEFELMKQARTKAGQVIGVDTDGGWFVPDQVIPDVIEALYRRSVLLDLSGDGRTRVSVIDGLSGATVRIPKFKSGVIAYWQGEVDESSITKANVGEINMKPRKLNALTKMSEEMQRMSSYGFEALLRKDMVKALATEVDRAVLYGNGIGDMPEGIVKAPNLQVYDGGTPAVNIELDWTGLSNMDLLIEEALLDEDGSFATISSPRYFNRISNLRVLNYSGQPASEAGYLAGLPPLTKSKMRDLIGDFGKTVMIPSNKNPGDAATATDVFRGNFGEVLVGRWSGIEVVTEGGYDIINDTRLVKLRMYMDVGFRYDQAIVRCPNAKAR